MSQTTITRIYWSLGLLDQVLAQYDEIEALLVLLVHANTGFEQFLNHIHMIYL